MSEETISVTPPKSFFWVAGLVFAWDLLGVGAYMSAVTMSPEAISALPAAEQALMANTPTWATAMFAIAVWGGILGTGLLLLRKAIAVPILIGSLAAVLVNMIYTWGMTNAADVYGAGQAGMAVVVLAIAAFIAWYANSAKSKGWIN